jgi:hypothetical protein
MWILYACGALLTRGIVVQQALEWELPKSGINPFPVIHRGGAEARRWGQPFSNEAPTPHPQTLSAKTLREREPPLKFDRSFVQPGNAINPPLR